MRRHGSEETRGERARGGEARNEVSDEEEVQRGKDSLAFTIRHIALCVGAGTPYFSPSLTTAPFIKSISVRLPCSIS